MEKVEYVVAIHKDGIPGRRKIGRFTNLEDAKKLMESEFLKLIDRARIESKKVNYKINGFTQYDVYVEKELIDDEGCFFSYTIDSRHTPFFRYGVEVGIEVI